MLCCTPIPLLSVEQSTKITELPNLRNYPRLPYPLFSDAGTSKGIWFSLTPACVVSSYDVKTSRRVSRYEITRSIDVHAVYCT